MIRERCAGPILVLVLLAAGGCSAVVSDGTTTPDGGNAGAGGAAGSTGGSTGGSAGGPAGGGAGTAATTGGVGGGAGAGGVTGAAGAVGGGAAGTGGGGAAGTGGGAAGASGGSAVGGRGGGAGSSGGSAAGASGGSAAGGRGGGAGSSGGGAAGGAGGTAGSGEIILDPTPGSYKQTCDGSMGVMIDATHFLDGNDEEQGMRLYTRATSGNPLKTIDISSAIGLSTSDEADLEDAARIGNRIFVIGSHGRNKSGDLERSRYRFFAMDVSGTSPSISLAVPGYSSKLLDQMLVASNWVTPNATVIATLTSASNLGKSTDSNLAPLAGGTNIEGLAWSPTAARPNQLLIGFRSPPQGGAAIVVSLLNAAEVLTGATAQFGEAMLIDLGGLGIRGMAWSPLHAAVLLIAGPRDDAAGPFRLFKWSGVAADAPVAVRDITGVPTLSAPEAIVTYANTRDVQILFDQGDHDISGNACKDASQSTQLFGDTIVHVP